MAKKRRKVLLVANAGGHLEQLVRLDNRLPFDGDRVWVTSENAQSRSLLAGRNVELVPNVGSRDYLGLARNLRTATRLVRPTEVEAVISTGSGSALAYLPLAAAMGIPTFYIESATRTHGPSFSGRVLQRIPGVRLHTQHERWVNDQWSYAGSVFDGFEVRQDSRPPTSIQRVVVSLGTTRQYGFRRLVEKLVKLLPPDATTLWQTGCTDVSGLGIDGRDQVSQAEMASTIRQADLLIAHAGTGIALLGLASERAPLLIPREKAYGEHVDDHQKLTANLLTARGLGVARDVDSLTYDDFELAASKRIDFDGAKCFTLGLAR